MGKWNLGRRNKRECVRFITYKKEPPLESNLDDMPNSKIHRYTESSEIRFPNQGARTEFSYFSFYFDTGSKAHKPEGTDPTYWNVQRRHVIGRGWKKNGHIPSAQPPSPPPQTRSPILSVCKLGAIVKTRMTVVQVDVRVSPWSIKEHLWRSVTIPQLFPRALQINTSLHCTPYAHKIWSHIARRVANMHQQRCTTRKPFQRFGDLLSNHPNPKKNNKISNEKVHCWKVSATFPRSLKCGNFQGKCKNEFFFTAHFHKCENSLETIIEHMQRKCMEGGAKKLSFLAIFCSATCARLLVHVRCPLNCIPSEAHFPKGREDSNRSAKPGPHGYDVGVTDPMKLSWCEGTRYGQKSWTWMAQNEWV